MNIYAFFITAIAGFSTLIGYFIIFYKGNKKNIIASSLGFASGIMLSISIFDLIPNSLFLLNNKLPVISILITFFSMLFGILVSILINSKIASYEGNKNKLYKLGIITMITIIIHNIPEGIATYITSDNNAKLGIKLAIAIALHNIPEGISISIPIYYSTKNKFKAFFFTFISGFSEIIGAFLSYLFLSKIINNVTMSILYSIIAGIMIQISTTSLFKEAYINNKKYSIIFFIIGFIFMLVNHLLFN